MAKLKRNHFISLMILLCLFHFTTGEKTTRLKNGKVKYIYLQLITGSVFTRCLNKSRAAIFSACKIDQSPVLSMSLSLSPLLLLYMFPAIFALVAAVAAATVVYNYYRFIVIMSLCVIIVAATLLLLFFWIVTEYYKTHPIKNFQSKS